VVLAKSLASLDRLSGGRVLPAFGLGVAESAEHQAFGVDRRDRGGWFNEALPLLRRLWTEDHVNHNGRRFRLTDVTIAVKPHQDPFEVWLGGRSDLELDRVGRLGDGWLPSFCTPEQVAAGRSRIEETAAAHDRVIDPQHYGALIPYRPDGGAIPEPVMGLLAKRVVDTPPETVVPELSWLPEIIGGFVDVGFSKFVLVPVTEPETWQTELDQVAATVLPLET
jgi:probable F420-dependent oxidoreductase